MAAIVDDEITVRAGVNPAVAERIEGDAGVGGRADDVACAPARILDRGDEPRPACRRPDLDEPAELPLERLDRCVLSVEQCPSNAGQVTLEMAVREEAAERPLLDRRRAGIDRVERGDERLEEARRHDRVAEPDAAVEQRLERAEMDHPAVLVEALEADRRHAAQDQVVGPAVLDDDRAARRRPRTGRRSRRASGIIAPVGTWTVGETTATAASSGRLSGRRPVASIRAGTSVAPVTASARWKTGSPGSSTTARRSGPSHSRATAPIPITAPDSTTTWAGSQAAPRDARRCAAIAARRSGSPAGSAAMPRARRFRDDAPLLAEHPFERRPDRQPRRRPEPPARRSNRGIGPIPRRAPDAARGAAG